MNARNKLANKLVGYDIEKAIKDAYERGMAAKFEAKFYDSVIKAQKKLSITDAYIQGLMMSKKFGSGEWYTVTFFTKNIK